MRRAGPAGVRRASGLAARLLVDSPHIATPAMMGSFRCAAYEHVQNLGDGANLLAGLGLNSMKANRQGLMRRAAVAVGMLATLGLGAIPATAVAQPKATVTNSESVTAKVTVKSIDRASRHLVVTNESGESFSIKAPPEARNFDNLKPGDEIAATYTVETEYVLSAPNTALPPDTATVVGARTAKGDLPGGMVANQIVVTGAVVGIDMANYTLKLVSPEGGAVHTVAVKTDEGRRAMVKMKVGDTITAHLTESLLLAVNPV
jgi:hypothetical protein